MSENKNEKLSLSQSIFEWVETFCLALLGVVIVFTFICRFVTVDGQSMEKTLSHGDRLIISNLFYTPKIGDIVVLQDVLQQENGLNGPIIKRVIATEGDTVDINNETWEITVTHPDGSVEVLKEDYANRIYAEDGETLLSMTPWGSQVGFPHIVEKGCVFVLGDNRRNSHDSRMMGDVDKRKILGKAYVRLFPLNKISFLG